MKTRTLNKIIDIISFFIFILLVSTGYLLRWILPHGSGRIIGEGSGIRAASKSVGLLWNMTGSEWGNIHYWLAVIFLFLISIHLILHWRVLLNAFKGEHGRESGIKAGLGLTGLVLLIGLAVAPFFSHRENIPRTVLQSREIILTHGNASTGVKDYSIHGDMTLAELQEIVGAPLSELKKEVNLPRDISFEARLGRLSKNYGFTMADVRRIAAGHKEILNKKLKERLP